MFGTVLSSDVATGGRGCFLGTEDFTNLGATDLVYPAIA